MGACHVCGAPGLIDGPCPSCGAPPASTPAAGLPDLEFDAPGPRSRKPAGRKTGATPRIDFAHDPRVVDLPAPSSSNAAASLELDLPPPPSKRAPAKTLVTAAGGLELDLPREQPKKPPPKPPPEQVEAKIELAVDPRARYALDSGPVSQRGASSSGEYPVAAVPSVRLASPDVRPVAGGAEDDAADARALAEYGAVPSNWLLAPIYAWRVLQRQRDLKLALAARKEEAARADETAQAALVALAQRARPIAQKQSAYAVALEEIERAEDAVRSRDKVLAAEQDAQAARLAAMDGRIAKLEAEAAQAQADERALAAEAAAAERDASGEESRLKRAEAELRAAQKREAGGASA
jgi:hypothetical protein